LGFGGAVELQLGAVELQLGLGLAGRELGWGWG